MNVKYVVFAVFVLLNLAFVIEPPEWLQSNDIDRAEKFYYKAKSAEMDGNSKKAIKYLKRAIKINRKNEYLKDLAFIYAKQGEVKKAYATVKSVVIKDNDPDVLKVELEAWKGYYALSLGIPRGPFSHFKNAAHFMKREAVDSIRLNSDLNNNAGVTRLFNQTATQKKHFHKVHINDYKQAKEYLEEAIRLNPDNCIAKHNLKMVKKVLEIPKDSMNVNQYVYKEWLQAQELPVCDCKIPPPPPHQEILTRLNKEKEVVFILDISGSMSVSTPNGRSRFQAMKDLVLSLIQDLDEDVEIGLITLGQNCTNTPILKYNVGELSREELSRKVEYLQLNGSTPLNNRLKQAQELFTKDKNEKAIFLCSDGLNTCNTRESTCQIGNSYKKKNITIYAFSLLLDDMTNSAEYAVYDCITRATYGELLGISETEEIEVNTKYISTAVFPLVLKKEDLVEGKFHFLKIEDLLERMDNLEAETETDMVTEAEK